MFRANFLRIGVGVAWALLLFTGASCGEGITDAVGYEGTGGAADAGPSDAGTDSGGGAGGAPGAMNSGGSGGCDDSCDGECAPLHPAGFSWPVLAWFGDNDGSAPACPDSAPKEQFELYGDLKFPEKTCGTCSCGPSAGSCTLPTSIAAHAAPCTPAEGTTKTPTDPPDSWDGSCTTESPIPAGLLCGDGIPCVQSVTIGPLGIVEEGCVALEGPTDGPESPTAPIPSPSFGEFARVCEGVAFGKCEADEHCVPKPVDEFQKCVWALGIRDCPPDEYTDRHLVAEGYTDERECTACTCGAAQGSDCSASISLYTQPQCSEEAFEAPASALKQTCIDIDAHGQAIAAKSAAAPTYEPGICEPGGGEVIGEVALVNPMTFCCLV